MTKAYTATASRDGAWWMLEITGPDLRRSGVTQVKRLDQAEEMVRDWIKTRFDTITDADFSVEVVADLEEEDVSIVEEAVAKRLAAEAATNASSSATVDAILRLDRMGLPSRDIGLLLGVSFQHAAKVAAAAKKPKTPTQAKSGAVTMPAPRSGRVVAVKKKSVKVKQGRRRVDA